MAFRVGAPTGICGVLLAGVAASWVEGSYAPTSHDVAQPKRVLAKLEPPQKVRSQELAPAKPQQKKTEPKPAAPKAKLVAPKAKPAAKTALRVTAKPARPEKKPINTFDIVTIDPKGVSVFAGLSRPSRRLIVMADGKAVGATTTDADGNWVLVTEKRLNPEAKITVRLDAAAKGRAPAKRPSAGKQVAKLAPSPKARPLTEPAPGPVAVQKKSSHPAARKVAARPSVPVNEVKAQMMKQLKRVVASARKSGKPVPPSMLTASAAVPAAPVSKAQSKKLQVAKRVQVAKRAPKPAAPVAAPRPLPIPVQFVYRTSEFTPKGKEAVGLLLDYLKASRVAMATLSGHADERGSHALNLELSHDRLKAVQAYLRAGGFEGKLDLRPFGETKPYQGVDRSKYTRAELFQLDRRVELQLTR